MSFKNKLKQTFEGAKESLIDILEPILAPLIGKAVEEAIYRAFSALMKKEENVVHGKVVIAGMYPVIDGELEKITDDTENEYDDAVVDGLKLSLERLAADHNIVLSNVDDD